MALPALRADDNTNTPPQGGRGGGGGFHGGPRGPMMMYDKLNLTDDQKAQIAKIIKDTEEERRQKIDAVLTDEQKAKLQAMREEMKSRMQGDGQGKPRSDKGNPFEGGNGQQQQAPASN